LTIDHALTVDEVFTRHTLGRLGDDLLSLDHALHQLTVVVVDGQTADRVRHGAPVPVAKILRWDRSASGAHGSRHRPVRIHDIDGCLVAIGKWSEISDGALKVEKVLTGRDL
jgi:tRNA U55 pseudouridine synthase TruB